MTMIVDTPRTYEGRSLEIRLQQAALKIAERKIDAANLPHAVRRRLERQFQGRVAAVVSAAATEILSALDELLDDDTE